MLVAERHWRWAQVYCAKLLTLAIKVLVRSDGALRSMHNTMIMLEAEWLVPWATFNLASGTVMRQQATQT